MSHEESATAVDPVTSAAPRAQLDALVDSLAAAFADDPVLAWLIPDSAARPKRLEGFFRLELNGVVLPAGRVLAVQGNTGALLELPPGAWRMPFRAQLPHAAAFTRVFGRRLPHAFALITKMERRHLREPHYYIPYVGVAPDAQGRGLGTALLRQTLDRCDAEGLPAYLEATSESNAILYERLGFKHLGPFTLASSPPIWPMRRPPGEPTR